jgi:membrane-associated phospholipid phosphatase
VKKIYLYALRATVALLLSITPAMAGITEDIGHDLASPVTTPANTYFWIGSAATIGFVLAQNIVDKPLQKWAPRANLLGKYNKWGDYAGRNIPNGIYAAGMLVAGALGDTDAYRRTEIMVLGTLYAVSWATVLKYTVREPRPRDGSDRTSFPSGHATSAFSFAGVVGAEHGPAWGALSYALATAVGYSRMVDNAHWFRDIVAGATIGISYGIGVHYTRSEKSGANAGLELAPVLGGGEFGIMARSRF